MVLENVTIGGTAAPSAAGSSSALKGISIGGAAAPVTSAKDSMLFSANAPAPSFSTPIAPAKPADTSGLFSKFLGFAGGVAGKAVNSFENFISPPDPEQVGKIPSSLGRTLAYLPSELARSIPGVADIQDDPSIAANLDMGDVKKAIPTALGETAKGFAAAPVVALADVYDAGRVFFGKDPNASFTLPVLGKITSNEFNVAQRVQAGQDPVAATLAEGSASIFNTLFFADLVGRVAGPRAVKVGETTGNINDLTQPHPSGPRPVIDSRPKTGRLYEAPTAYNKGGAQVLPPEVLGKMKSQGIDLGSRFDPKQPVFFRVTVGKGGAYTGEIMQVKPSYLETAYEKLFGTKLPTESTTLPALLGAKSNVPSEVLNPADIAPIANAAKPADIITLHSATVKEGDIVKSMEGVVHKAPVEKAPVVPPAPPATSHVVSHNALRLLDTDTSKALEGSAILDKEIKEAVAEHGPDVVTHALQEKIGVDVHTAERMVSEATAPKTQKEIEAKNEAILNRASPEAIPKEFRKLSGEIKTARAAIKTQEYTTKPEYQQDMVIYKDKKGQMHVMSERNFREGQPAGGILPPGPKPEGKIQAIVKRDGSIVKPPTGKKPPAQITGKLKILKPVFEKAATFRSANAFAKFMRESGGDFKDAIEEYKAAGGENMGLDMIHTVAKIAKENGEIGGTQKDIVKKVLSEKEKASIKEIAEETKILEPNIRRILGVGTKEGEFERVGDGVYTIKVGDKEIAYVVPGDALEVLPKLAEGGFKADMVFLDIPYDTKAVKGGNRGANNRYSLLSVAQFGEILDSTKKILRSPDSPLIHMFSQATSGMKEMEVYNNLLIEKGFIPIARGNYNKTYENGQPVGFPTSKGYMITKPEGIIILNQSGKNVAPEANLEFTYVRPKGYHTEKAADLLKELIAMTTKEGDTVLDPFAGSGVTAAEAVKSGRNAVAIEKDKEQAKKIVERVQRELDQKVELLKEANAHGDTEEAVKIGNEMGTLRSERNAAQHTLNMEAGFIAPGVLVEDIANKTADVKDFLEETNKKVEITNHIGDDLYKLETNAKRDLEVAIRLIKKVDITPEDAEAIYHYEEDQSLPLTSKQKELYENVIKPIGDASTQLFEKLRNEGLPMESENYTPRNVKGKTKVLDRITDTIKGVKNKIVNAGQGGILSRSTGSFKHRVYRVLVDESGKRTVVSIKDGKVNRHFNKDSVSLGSAKRIMSKASVMEKEIAPLQRMIDKFQTQIDAIKRVKVGAPISNARIGSLIKQITEVADYIDRNVGAFTPAEFKPDLERLAKLEEKLKILGTVKTVDQIVNTDKIVSKLEDAIRDLSNKMGEVEARFADTPDAKVFNADDGKQYQIKEATTREIERETDTEYHKNVLANRILQYLKLRQIDRANQFIEDFKNDPEFSNIAAKANDPDAPAGFKRTRLLQFPDYVFEPRVAEQLDVLADQMSRDDVMRPLTAVNRFLRNAIFFNPFIHVPNLSIHWAVNRGAARFANPAAYVRGIVAFGKAWNAIMHHNDDYLHALEHGAPLLASEASSKELGKVLLEQMAKELEANPDALNKVTKALGYVNPANLLKLIYRFSNKFTWTINDLLTMQAVYEDMAAKGISIDKAIEHTGRHIPNYRLPPRIGDKALSMVAGEKGGAAARMAGFVMKSPNLTMFGAYHYGALKSYGEMIKTLVTGDSEDAGGTGTKEAFKNRAESVDKMIMMALIGLVLYPYLDKLAQKITGNPNARFRRAGSITFPENLYQYATGEEDAGQFFQSVLTPAVGTKALAELIGNREFFTGAQIYGPGGEGFLNYVSNQLAPIQQARRVTGGKQSAVDFFASLGGISSPKSSPSELQVNSMIYQEKPMVSKEMKAMIVAGDTAGAQEIAHDFNIRLKAEIKQSLIENGKSGSDAQVDYVWNKNAIRMPTQETINTYQANQGSSFVDKVFSDGKPKIKTDVPIENDSLIHAVMVYAHAAVVDPAAALNDVLKGQVIRKVDNGTVIVYRMSVADSQAIKKAGGGDNPTMKLDHTLPLQLGGTNEESNLKLVPTDVWASYTPVEDYLGTALRNGTVDKATAQRLMLNFKNGILTFDDIKKQVGK